MVARFSDETITISDGTNILQLPVAGDPKTGARLITQQMVPTQEGDPSTPFAITFPFG